MKFGNQEHNMAASGNSVSIKSFQSFTVSDGLLAKVVEAVKAGEKDARTSGDVKSFEVFYSGYRQNISIGRIFIVPAKVCDVRNTFPIALLYGTVVREFNLGEETADLITNKIGDTEFDEYSQADYSTIKEKLFTKEDGKTTSLVLFAPHWSNIREYHGFKFTDDDSELSNLVRHLIFSTYYNPSVSSAFNALMTTVDTSKLDVTDITPKLTYPFLSENPLRAYPELVKQGGWHKEKVFLTAKTADAIEQDILDPQELNVFEALDTALTETTMPDTEPMEEVAEFDLGGTPNEGNSEIPEIDAIKQSIETTKEASNKKADGGTGNNPDDPWDVTYNCNCIQGVIPPKGCPVHEKASNGFGLDRDDEDFEGMDEHIGNQVAQGFTSGHEAAFYWSIDLGDEVEGDDTITLEHIAGLIRKGYTSGRHPYWSLKVNPLSKSSKSSAKNCTICHKPIILSPSAKERAAKDVTGKSPQHYTDAFTTHPQCLIEKRKGVAKTFNPYTLGHTLIKSKGAGDGTELRHRPDYGEKGSFTEEMNEENMKMGGGLKPGQEMDGNEKKTRCRYCGAFLIKGKCPVSARDCGRGKKASDTPEGEQPIGIELDATGLPVHASKKAAQKSWRIEGNGQGVKWVVFTKGLLGKEQIIAEGTGTDKEDARAKIKSALGENTSPANKIEPLTHMSKVVSAALDKEVGDDTDAMSSASKAARKKNENKLNRYATRKNADVELTEESIWADITEDFGPAPVVEIPGESSGSEGGSFEESKAPNFESKAPAEPKAEEHESEESPKEEESEESEPKEEKSENPFAKEKDAAGNKSEEHFVTMKHIGEKNEHSDVPSSKAKGGYHCDKCGKYFIKSKTEAGKKVSAKIAELRKAKEAKRELSVPEKHQLTIAKRTLNMPDGAVGIAGGPSKAEAREIIKRLTGQEPKEYYKGASESKKADDVSGELSEAKSLVENPDVIDSDINQPTVSVEEAAKVAKDKNYAMESHAFEGKKPGGGTSLECIHCGYLENAGLHPKKKKKADVSSDISEAKSEVENPDVIDTDINQPTVSVEEAAKVAHDDQDASTRHALNSIPHVDSESEDACPNCGNAAVNWNEELKDYVCDHCGWCAEDDMPKAHFGAAGDEHDEAVEMTMGFGDLADLAANLPHQDEDK